jgi:hypothetical protein
MDDEISATLELIKIMTRKYQNIPGAAPETVNALLDEVEILRDKLQRALAVITSGEDRDYQQLQEIGDALAESRDASVSAQIYIQNELNDARKILGTIQIGKKARYAYQSPRIGMGYTEGNFVDRRK